MPGLQDVTDLLRGRFSAGVSGEIENFPQSPALAEAADLIDGLRESTNPDQYMRNLMDAEPNPESAVAVKTVENDRGDMELEETTLAAMDQWLSQEAVQQMLTDTQNYGINHIGLGYVN